MKKSFTLIALVLAVCALQAQINRSDLPAIGDSQFYTGLDTTGIVEGPGGTGLTWDYSSATTNSITGTVEYVDPASHPQNSMIPGANLTRVDPDGNYVYYSVDNDSMLIVGEQSITGQPCAYPSAGTLVRFPANVSDAATDSVNGEYFDGFLTNVTRWGEVTTTVDANGTLITPNATWNNVTRVFQQYTYRDSSWTGAAISDILLFRYEWYAAGRTMPVFITNTRLVSVNGGPFTEERAVWWADTTVVGLEDALSITEMQLAPNPSEGLTTVRYQLENASEVNIGVYNLMGELVREGFSGMQSSGAHSQELDASNLSAGVYFVRLQAGEAVQNRKLVIQ
jgi:hypothetical protein